MTVPVSKFGMQNSEIKIKQFVKFMIQSFYSILQKLPVIKWY